jgi:hypothetical protein
MLLTLLKIGLDDQTLLVFGSAVDTEVASQCGLFFNTATLAPT